MVASAATSTMILHVPSSSSPPPSGSSGKTVGKIGASSIDAARRISSVEPKYASPSPRKLQVKAVGTKLGLKTDDEVTVSPSPRTLINLIPDWSILVIAIFLAAERRWKTLDWKPKRSVVLVDDTSGPGRLLQDGLVFRQSFGIRSYEIGPDRSASVETLMNHMQETALSHSRSVGLLNDGFGSSPEMSRRNLIRVVTKMNILVDRYPTWGDVVEVDTWVAAFGKNGMRRDWLLRDSNTGHILSRASSVWVLMNKETRRLSKIPKEVREEIHVCLRDCPPILEDEEEDDRKLPNLMIAMLTMSPKRSDLDVNQHVNNVKYVGWLLESAPLSIVETHELARITLEYRRECTRDSVLRSLSRVVGDSDQGLIECQHSLRNLQGGRGGGDGGREVVKGKTTWRAKQSVDLSRA